jgi:hypothetical protein
MRLTLQPIVPSAPPHFCEKWMKKEMSSLFCWAKLHFVLTTELLECDGVEEEDVTLLDFRMHALHNLECTIGDL